MLNRLLKFINSLALLAVACAAGAVYWVGWRSVAEHSGSFTAPVSVAATVDFDTFGVPHIRAATAEDAWFLQGYVTAGDRLFQMELARRLATGTVSEVIGARALEADMEARQFRIAQLATEVVLNAEERTAFTAYARGVNHYIETHRGRLPAEYRLLGFEPAHWRVEDSLAIALHMVRTLSTTWREDLLVEALLQKLPRDRVDALMPMRAGDENVTGMAGSNGWALAGSRTATGKPILANDPHLSPSLPGIWYQSHLQYPEADVAGVSVPGMPGIQIGHNGRIAWGHTMLHFDMQDVYLERTQGNFALYDGRAEPMREERGVIAVKGGATAAVQTRISRHGPILAAAGGRSIALRWTASDPAIFRYPYPRLNRATNWTEFRAALAELPGPASAFVYADGDGNIGYQAAGKLPLRRNAAGDTPMDGTDPKLEWDGYIPFEDLPSEFNPPSGLVVAANHNPFPKDYKYTVHGNFAPPYRFRQIVARLGSRPKWAAGEMVKVQRDAYSQFLHQMGGHFARAVKAKSAADLADVARMLESWNGQAEPDLAAPLVVTLGFEALREELVAPYLPAAPADAKNAIRYSTQMSMWAIHRLVEKRAAGWVEDWDAALVAALRKGIGEGTKTQGSNIASWKMSRGLNMELKPPVLGDIPWIGPYFRLREVALPGVSTSVHQLSARAWPSMRFVTDFANLEESVLTLPAGNSGHPFSGHFRDQWDNYRGGHSTPMPYKSVNAKSTMQFRPE